MCGIVGVVDIAGRPVARELVHAMNDRLIHRGPDEDGYWVEGGTGLGMRRLSIMDVSGGTQPFWNETGSIVSVYNGEIYNFNELRAGLECRGHVLTTKCDTEVIPHLYEDYGSDFVQHLNGMFAIALWDRHRRTLLLARDRLGIKPLFYTCQNGQFFFASELKGLEPCGISRDICAHAIYHYLTYGYIPAPLTIYKNVFKLLPGCILELTRDRIATSRYWCVEFKAGDVRPEEELVSELHDRLRTAVRLRMASDVPLGAFLSGGVDSSLVVALMCEASTSPIKTFSISFTEASHDESSYAQAVAARYNTEHTALTVRADIWKDVKKIVRQFDEPFGDSSAIPTYFLSALTREHVTVAMSGDGGDELFAGYDRYLDYFRKRPLFKIPRPVRAATFGLAGRLVPRGTRGKRFLRTLAMNPLDDYVTGNAEIRNEEILTSAFLSSVVGIDPLGPAKAYLDQSVATELDTLCLHDIGLYLPDDILTKVDRTSMAVSLEVRVPILDHHVVEFAASLPAGLRMKGGTGKYLLKKVLSGYMPAEHVHRPKRGFGIPLGEWFRCELREELMETLSPHRVREVGVFNADAVRFLVDQHMSGRRDHNGLLWRLMVLHWWFASAGNDGAQDRLMRSGVIRLQNES